MASYYGTEKIFSQYNFFLLKVLRLSMSYNHMRARTQVKCTQIDTSYKGQEQLGNIYNSYQLVDT